MSRTRSVRYTSLAGFFKSLPRCHRPIRRRRGRIRGRDLRIAHAENAGCALDGVGAPPEPRRRELVMRRRGRIQRTYLIYGGVAASEDDSGTVQVVDKEVALYCAGAPLNSAATDQSNRGAVAFRGRHRHWRCIDVEDVDWALDGVGVPLCPAADD